MIALAADHAGYPLKEEIKKHLLERGFDVKDFGTDSDKSVDYAVFAKIAGESRQASAGSAFSVAVPASASRWRQIRSGESELQTAQILSPRA